MMVYCKILSPFNRIRSLVSASELENSAEKSLVPRFEYCYLYPVEIYVEN